MNKQGLLMYFCLENKLGQGSATSTKTMEDDGWLLVKTGGSHRQFKHPIKKGKVTVSGKPNVEIPMNAF